MTEHEIPKAYNPNEAEPNIYDLWQDSGYFNPDKCLADGITPEQAETFSMVLPPPNVTGILHTGHAAMLTIEDILARYNRMKGKRTLWLPGTDHAAIATQSKVEKEILKNEDKSRHDLGREEFLKRVENFAHQSHDSIVQQMKKMGASVDWSREAFTLDAPRSYAVRTAFKRMYDAGLIYRGFRVVNWDPKGQTTISDDEVVYEEQAGKLYTFRYSKDFPIAIATTRPETKVGDTAVAVHPDDARYKQYIGQTFELEFCEVPLSIKIVADETVDTAFGTGAVGVTPAHSMADWEIAQRHNLPLIPVINEYGKMMVGAESLRGKKTTEAREAVVEWLKQNGLLEKEEDIKQNISRAERTNGIIEPLPKLQWFVDVNKKFKLEKSKLKGIADGQEVSLKELMRTAVESGQINIMPERFAKTYFHWIENLRDWCISRQIWYGHRIPVWYKEQETYVGTDAPEGEGWEQDQDTLDTWFSSGLWTFSTLGWPEETQDMQFYHPTDVLETGYDILFFWVARMILMTGFLLGDVPFKNVYLHGLVRDEKGRKISKSLGNSIDPVELTEKYGTDALRMALIVGVAPGNDNNLGENKVKAYKLFANKLWNIARFIMMNAQTSSFLAQNAAPVGITDADKQILDRLTEIQISVSKALEQYRLHEAAHDLYHFAWHEFADVYIEASKSQLTDQNTQGSTAQILTYTLSTILKLLHPFMPFVTEEIYQHLQAAENKKLLMVEKWPTI